MPRIDCYHGTVADFETFDIPPSGVHFGTLDQAAHAATLKLARMPADAFAARPVDHRGFRGRIIRARLDIRNPKRVDDLGTDAAWAAEIARADAEGHDGLIYANAFEGRRRSDSYAVWDAARIVVIDPAA